MMSNLDHLNKYIDQLLQHNSHMCCQVNLNGHQLEEVNSQKQLGIILNDSLDYDEQWAKTSKITNPHVYLLKQLKRMNFREELLINVYRSITLSQYSYAAPLLVSASTNAKNEMIRQQTRCLNIIGISIEEAAKKYNIEPIINFLESECVKKVQRIIKDESHDITKKLPKKGRQGTRSGQIAAPKANTAKYLNSCIPNSLRIIRDGYSNKYTQPRKKETTTTAYCAAYQAHQQQNRRRTVYPAKPTAQQLIEPVTNNPVHKCSICSKILPTAQGLKAHTTRLHGRQIQRQ